MNVALNFGGMQVKQAHAANKNDRCIGAAHLIINSNSVSLHKCLLPLRLETIGRFAIFLLQIHFYAFCDGF